MYNDNQVFRADLRRAIGRISCDLETCKDLLQDALARLALVESTRPGQTRSWYLENGVNWALKCYRHGCSVDSPKRCRGRRGINDASESPQPGSYCIEPDDSIAESLSARDSALMLSQRLQLRGRRILGYLVDGLSAAQVARRMRISHQAVSEHRQMIARAAKTLGIFPSAMRQVAPRSY